jgi:hypothetical protein
MLFGISFFIIDLTIPGLVGTEAAGVFVAESTAVELHSDLESFFAIGA